LPMLNLEIIEQLSNIVNLNYLWYSPSLPLELRKRSFEGLRPRWYSFI